MIITDITEISINDDTEKMSTFQAAKMLGISIRTVQQWMEKGLLNGCKTPGGHRRVNASEVRALAEKRQREKSPSKLVACKVLIIEDDPDICRLYEMMSKVWRTPTSIQFAHDDLQGLIAMGEFQPNFVIVDLNIPLVDGFHLIKTLSAQFNANTQRYCVVTGLGHDEIHKRGELPKNCPIFGKPIDFPELEKLIAKAYSEILQSQPTAQQVGLSNA